MWIDGTICNNLTLHLHSLDDDPKLGLVELVCNTQATIHHDSEDGVHGADVVQHIAVLQHKARKEDQEVEAPHHLAEPVAGEWQ